MNLTTLALAAKLLVNPRLILDDLLQSALPSTAFPAAPSAALAAPVFFAGVHSVL